MVLTDVYTANGEVYGDLHSADGNVLETVMYYVPAMCNDWGEVVA